MNDNFDESHVIYSEKFTYNEQYQQFYESSKEQVTEMFIWMSGQYRLPKITVYEMVLFLNATDRQLDATKQLIVDYYTFRTYNPNIFGNRIIYNIDMQNAKSNSMFVPLPGYTNRGHRVLYCKVINPDADQFDVMEALKLFAFAQDLLIIEEGVVPGYEIIVDLSGYTLQHIAKFTVEAGATLMYMLQRTFLGPLKGFHYININEIWGNADAIFEVMKPKLTKEFQHILIFHISMETVYHHFPRDILPNELGGYAGPREHERLIYWEYLNQNKQYFIEEERIRRLHPEAPEFN